MIAGADRVCPFTQSLHTQTLSKKHTTARVNYYIKASTQSHTDIITNTCFLPTHPNGIVYLAITQGQKLTGFFHDT